MLAAGGATVVDRFGEVSMTAHDEKNSCLCRLCAISGGSAPCTSIPPCDDESLCL